MKRERFALRSQRVLIVMALVVCMVMGVWALVSGERGTGGARLGVGAVMVVFGVHGLVFCRELVATVGRGRSYFPFGPVMHALMSALIATIGVLMGLGALREGP